MIIAELPFREFDSLLKIWAKKKRFGLIAYLVSRNADIPRLFEEIENNWSAIHDVTGDKILFVLIDGKNQTFQNDRRQIEGSYGFYLYSPFCQMISPLETELSYDGYFKKYIVPHNDFDKHRKWQQNHSVSMTEVANVLKLEERNIPCLYFHLVSSQINLTFSLKNIANNFSIYKVLKKISEADDYFIDLKFKKNDSDFLNSKKYKKYLQHKENIQKFISEKELDTITKKWLLNVLDLQSVDNDVYKKIAHFQNTISKKEFGELRASLNSLVHISSDSQFLELLDLELKKQVHVDKTPGEFATFIENCFIHDYEME